MSPGSLVHVGERLVQKVTFRVIDYTPDTVRELESESVRDCVKFEGKDSPAWIMVTGLHDVERIGELLQAYNHRIAKEKGMNNWVTVAPDYAYGRDATVDFVEFIFYLVC